MYYQEGLQGCSHGPGSLHAAGRELGSHRSRLTLLPDLCQKGSPQLLRSISLEKSPTPSAGGDSPGAGRSPPLGGVGCTGAAGQAAFLSGCVLPELTWLFLCFVLGIRGARVTHFTGESRSHSQKD